MSQPLKKIAFNSSIYFISSIVQRFFTFFLFPIFTSYLTKADYGINGMMGSLTIYLVFLMGFELNKAAFRRVSEHKNDTAMVEELYGNIFTVLILSCAVITAFFLLAGNFICTRIMSGVAFYPYYFWTVISLPFLVFILITKSFLQARQESVKYVVFDSLFFLSNIVLNLFFVVKMKMDVRGLILSTLISTVLFAISSYILFFRKVVLKFNTAIIKSLFSYSLPMIPFIGLGILGESSDKFVLNHYHGIKDSGVYYIAVTIAIFFSVLKESMTNAVLPWMIENHNKYTKPFIAGMLADVYLTMSLVAVGLSWFTFELLNVLSNNKDLLAAYRFTPILINANLFIFLSSLFNIPVYISKTSVKKLPLTTLVSASVALITSFLLIPRFGMWGGSVSCLLSYFSLAVSAAIISKKETVVTFHYRKIAMICVFTFLISLCPLYLPHQGSWQIILVKVVAFSIILFAAGIYFFKKYNLKEVLFKKNSLSI